MYSHHDGKNAQQIALVRNVSRALESCFETRYLLKKRLIVPDKQTMAISMLASKMHRPFGEE